MSSRFCMSGQLNMWQEAWGWTWGISVATTTPSLLTTYQVMPPRALHARGVGAEAALQGIACMGWDLSLRD